MSRAILVLLLLMTACTVPSLEELEAERPSGCDAQNPCREGDVCVEGRCVTPTADMQCRPGTQEVCGQSGPGECRQGVRQCGASGTWGACEGEVASVPEVCNGKDDDCDGVADNAPQTPLCELQAGVCAQKRRACNFGQPEDSCSDTTYGTGYERAETRCDGLDNDCDGTVDEDLAQLCPRQAGVCGGSQQRCTEGGYPGCTAALYQAHSSDWQAFERSCDGRDNDCDGLTDSWTPLNVSQSSALISSRVAAVPVRRTSSGPLDAVLVVYEEGNALYSRVFAADGTMSAPQLLKGGQTAELRHHAPALATDGTRIILGYVHEQTNATGVVRSVRLEWLGADGSSLSRSAAALGMGALPVRLTLALNASHVLVLAEDRGTISANLYAGTVSHDFSVTSTITLLEQGAAQPHAVPSTDGQSFIAAWQGNSLTVALVTNEARVTSKTGTSMPVGGSPFITYDSGTQGAVKVYYLDSFKTGLWSIRCVGTNCGTPSRYFALGESVDNVRMAVATSSDSHPSAVAYDVTVSDTRREAHVASATASGLGTPFMVHPTSINGARPVPVVLPDLGRYVAFDSAYGRGTSALDNEVFLRPFCPR